MFGAVWSAPEDVDRIAIDLREEVVDPPCQLDQVLGVETQVAIPAEQRPHPVCGGVALV
jgi:hypothetical protein